jgi:signal transduction histidine kinase
MSERPLSSAPWRAILWVCGRFIPPAQRVDPLRERQAFLLVGVLLLVCSSLPMHIAFQIGRGHLDLLAISLTTFATYGGILIAYRRGASHEAAGWAVTGLGALGVLLTAWQSGGVYSAVTPMLSMLPLLSLALQGPGTALGWAGLAVALTVALGAAPSLGFELPRDPEQFYAPFPWTLNLVLLVVYSAAIAFFLDDLNRRQRRQLEEARRIADGASSAKSTFLANMSHELRTPMNGVLGLTEVMLHDPALSDRHREHLRTIHASGRALVQILNDILDLSKIEAGRMDTEHIPYDARQVTEDVVRLFAEVALRKGLTLGLRADPRESALVMGDPTRVRQVLTNLIGNAVKFTTDGEIRVELQIAAGRARWSVVDSGPGIAQEVQEQLFAPFTQGDASTARRHGGTGLGLTISRHLARLMGGDVHLQSQLGQGSRFSLDVPAPPAPAGRSLPPRTVPPAEPAPAEGAPSSAERRPLVLLVEDVPVNQMVAQMMLARLGLDVELVEDGPTALARMQAGGPWGAVLMDWQLPGMDGLEVVRRARAAGFRTPIIGVTAHVSSEDQALGAEAGMDAFLGKPYTREQLRAALQALGVLDGG